MKSPLRILGVLAGEDLPVERLAAWAKSADVVLAADGAADRLLKIGISPTKTVGDLDSLRGKLPAERVEHEPDQNSSDCDKLLALAFRMGNAEITLVGVEGDRLDHVLGSLASAARSPLRVRLGLRKGLGWILKGPCEVAIASEPDELFSLMPLERCTGVFLSGVNWQLDSVDLAPSGLVSLSNRATGRLVEARIQKGVAAAFLLSPRAELVSW